MKLRQPRRIFRTSSAAKRRLRPGLPVATVLAAIGGVAAVAALAVAMLSDGRSIPHARAQAQTLSGTLVAEAPSVIVVDGETLRLHDTVVRLQGVTAPARGVSCRRDDGAAYDCGAAATQALAGIVRDRRVACRLQGRDPGGLPQGACEASGTDVNAAIVEAGWARAEPDAGKLGQAERAARSARRGAWDGSGAVESGL